MHERIRGALDEYGSVAIWLTSGEEIELDQDSTEVEDDGVIRVEFGDSTGFFDSSMIEAYWVPE